MSVALPSEDISCLLGHVGKRHKILGIRNRCIYYVYELLYFPCISCFNPLTTRTIAWFCLGDTGTTLMLDIHMHKLQTLARVLWDFTPCKAAGQVQLTQPQAAGA